MPLGGVRPLVIVETIAMESGDGRESRMVQYFVFSPPMGVKSQRLDGSPVRFAGINNINISEAPSVELLRALALARARTYLETLASSSAVDQQKRYRGIPPLVLEPVPTDQIRVLAMLEEYASLWEAISGRAVGEQLKEQMIRCISWKTAWFRSEEASVPQHLAQGTHQPS